MKPNVGDRLSSEGSDTQVIVVRASADEIELTCGGHAMTTEDRPASGEDGGPQGVKLGKRYADADSGVELLCTRPGGGPLELDGRPLEVKQAKSLPSSD